MNDLPLPAMGREVAGELNAPRGRRDDVRLPPHGGPQLAGADIADAEAIMALSLAPLDGLEHLAVGPVL